MGSSSKILGALIFIMSICFFHLSHCTGHRYYRENRIGFIMPVMTYCVDVNFLFADGSSNKSGDSGKIFCSEGNIEWGLKKWSY